MCEQNQLKLSLTFIVVNLSKVYWIPLENLFNFSKRYIE